MVFTDRVKFLNFVSSHIQWVKNGKDEECFLCILDPDQNILGAIFKKDEELYFYESASTQYPIEELEILDLIYESAILKLSSFLMLCDEKEFLNEKKIESQNYFNEFSKEDMKIAKQYVKTDFKKAIITNDIKESEGFLVAIYCTDEDLYFVRITKKKDVIVSRCDDLYQEMKPNKICKFSDEEIKEILDSFETLPRVITFCPLLDPKS